MGGDDSQKLLPWRGIHSSPGRKPPAQLRINNVTETAGWNLALTPPSLAGLAVASATGRLGHFWKAHPGQFWRAPKGADVLCDRIVIFTMREALAQPGFHFLRSIVHGAAGTEQLLHPDNPICRCSPELASPQRRYTLAPESSI